MKLQTRIKKQVGFTLIEIMIAMSVMGAAAALVLVYKSYADEEDKVNQTVTAMTRMVSKIKSFYGASQTYNGITMSTVNNMKLVLQPFTWDGTATAIRDGWGNAMTMNGNAAGATPTFSVTIGGATEALDPETCISLATKLANGADVVNVGAASAANGLITGGVAYKTSASVLSMSNLTGSSGCGATSPVIGLQYR